MQKVDRETAEAEFIRYCEKQRVDIDPDMTEEDQKSFNVQKKRIIRAIETGDLVVTENGVAVFSVAGMQLEFKQPKASCLLAMDRAKKGADTEAMFKLMGDICGVAPASFSKIDLRDMQVCQALVMLFLAS